MQVGGLRQRCWEPDSPKRSRTAATLVALLALAFLSFAPSWPTTSSRVMAQAPARPTEDAEFAKLVREWTTRAEFLSPLVDHLPVVAGIPSPKDVLGYHVGTPRKLTRTTDALKYYRALAAATPRVKVLIIGKTDEGREINIVVVASEDSIRDLEQHRKALGQLADPRGLTEPAAQEIIARTKPIYHLIGGLHSGETGPPEMLMELAYRLAVEDSPLIRRIRDQVIVTILPAADPDGRDRYVDWYYRHLVEISNERDRVAGPPYWGKYVFHDNNRDINYSQVSMRALLHWYLEWHPPIMHDLHESVPFLYTFSGQAPQNPALDPILFGEMPMFANFEMAQLTKYGMPGVWTHAFVDMWSPGYLAFMSSNHNGLVRMYETFGNGGATTMKRTIDRAEGGEAVPGRGAQTTREWYRPNPPYKEVEWSMRNNTNFMQTAVLTALQFTSAFPQVVLENFYLKSRNAIASGTREAPHGFVIPAEQPDRTRVALLVNLLRRQGIEVGRAKAAVKLTDGSHPAGVYLVKRNQPYGRLAKILLEKQDFPEGNLRTYDDTGWTMGLMLHAEVKPTNDKAVLNVPVEPVTEAQVRGAMAGERGADALLVKHTGGNAMTTLRYRLKEVKVMALDEPFVQGGVTFPAGSFVIPAMRQNRSVVEMVRQQSERLGLDVTGARTMPSSRMHEVDVPRLAMYSTWGNTQEVGWVRHAFDQFEVPFDLIHKERVRQGNLRTAYDVILIPSQGRTSRGLVYDIDMRGKPLAYTTTAGYPTHGMYGSSEDIRGGMGLEGVIELQRFVESGGVVITLGMASFFPPEFGLSRSATASRPSAQFYAPGPIVQAEILKPLHPIFYGYRDKTVPVRFANGPLLQVGEAERDEQTLMRFVGGDAAVLSGLMRGANEIRNRPAIVDAPLGRGRVLVFATNPCYRWQNHGEFGMLFNAVLHWNDVTTVLEKKAPAPTTSAARGPAG
jgi:Zinc carboxypeptidase